jgi:hypothetical protein
MDLIEQFQEVQVVVFRAEALLEGHQNRGSGEERAVVRDHADAFLQFTSTGVTN